MHVANLFDQADPPVVGETFETLLRHRNLHIERIVSSASPEPGTYVQAQDEWVMLVKGRARLRIGDEAVDLQAGDHLFLAAGTPHSVESTEEGSMWLAVHLHPEA
jgi:cupin 2 domain-containing protein